MNLAVELNPDLLLIDDKKARKEAHGLGFIPVFTTDVLREAQSRNLIDSYENMVDTLAKLQIYLPD